MENKPLSIPTPKGTHMQTLTIEQQRLIILGIAKWQESCTCLCDGCTALYAALEKSRLMTAQVEAFQALTRVHELLGHTDAEYDALAMYLLSKPGAIPLSVAEQVRTIARTGKRRQSKAKAKPMTAEQPNRLKQIAAADLEQQKAAGLTACDSGTCGHLECHHGGDGR
jgi:hypothetical protein